MRLDFFRGLGMFIIFVAHVPINEWNFWIPAAFGFSDATEIFVFCSGMASAIAFGGVFARSGYLLGTARCAHRVWQVYWSHVALFLVTVAVLVVMDDIRGETFYIERLYVLPFFEDPGNALIGLLTLTYVPNYFDILPMYLVMLAMIPIVVRLGEVGSWAVFAFMGTFWLASQFGWLQLPAEFQEGRDRSWFFNPFAWQLVFFTGFAFMRGWIKPPRANPWLIAIAIVVVILNALLDHPAGWRNSELIFQARDLIWPFVDKTNQGILRFVHFLSLAYLAYLAAGEAGRRLQGTGLWGWIVAICRKVGQQALAVFLASMVLAQIAGGVLDFTGRNFWSVPLVNLAGFALLVAVAHIASFFKSEPWRRYPHPPARA